MSLPFDSSVQSSYTILSLVMLPGLVTPNTKLSAIAAPRY